MFKDVNEKSFYSFSPAFRLVRRLVARSLGERRSFSGGGLPLLAVRVVKMGLF